jgi:hypothetical protein
MTFSIGKNLKIYSAAALSLYAMHAFSYDLKGGHLAIQGGGYFTTQGKSQFIRMRDLIGDQYTVTHRNSSNGLFGLGYLVDGPQFNRFNLQYGVNAFYLAKTTVRGTIAQEQLYTNLAFSYGVSHVPIYATLKALTNVNGDRYALTGDVGIGPSFNIGSSYQDRHFENDYTFRDRAYDTGSKTSFSAMAGIGIRANHLIGEVPLEIGYRFFYLGAGQLSPRTDHILDNLKTGNGYAHAVVVTLTV